LIRRRHARQDADSGRDPSGFFITSAIGIAGSFIATFGGQALGLYHTGEPAGFIGSLVSAIALTRGLSPLIRRSGVKRQNDWPRHRLRGDSHGND
jgi:hypothetical protein